MTNLAYSVERIYETSVEKLWHAFTDAQALGQWYCPPFMTVRPGSSVSEPVVGGAWKNAVDAPNNAGTAFFWGRYTVVVPNERAEHTLFYSQTEADFDAADESGPSHLVVLDFETKDAGAWVRYSQYGEMPAEMAEGARQGMETYFDSLAAFLSR
jgi:uncharacterized protein YndB with AHSA1/START domain